VYLSILVQRPGYTRLLHSFPTRRSSDLAAGVQDLLLAGVERMARGADLGADDAIRLGAAGGERVAAGAGHLGLDVCGVDLSLHRSEEHTSELQSRFDLVCRLLLEKKKTK